MPSSYLPEKEVREILPVTSILVRCSAEVRVQVGTTPSLVVHGEDPDSVKSVITTFLTDGTLIIDQEVVALKTGVYVHASGRGAIAAAGDVHVVAAGPGASVVIGGRRVSSHHAPKGFGRRLIELTLPTVPPVTKTGSGRIILQGLEQPHLDVTISGSGNLSAEGHVGDLAADVTGSGSIQAKHLCSSTANLILTGSGSIDVTVRQFIRAQVVGSGSVVVRGDPPQRNCNTVGSGLIRFSP